MYLMASGTDISSLITLASGTISRKPEVGLGVAGTNTQTTFWPVLACTSSCWSLVMNPMEYTPGCGNSTSTTVRKAVLLAEEKASLTCLVAP